MLTQSKRHGFLISLLQIPHLVVAVNKMDLVDYSEEAFNKIVAEYREFSRKLDIHDISFIPVSALRVTTSPPAAPTCPGTTATPAAPAGKRARGRRQDYVDFRFPVQYVQRPNLDFRGFAGTITSGTIRVGEQVAPCPRAGPAASRAS